MNTQPQQEPIDNIMAHMQTKYSKLYDLIGSDGCVNIVADKAIEIGDTPNEAFINLIHAIYKGKTVFIKELGMKCSPIKEGDYVQPDSIAVEGVTPKQIPDDTEKT